MPHNLARDERSGEIAMFCVGDRQAAWHGLGQRIVEAPDWATAYRLAHLDYEVIKQRMISPIQINNMLAEIRERQADLTKEEMLALFNDSIEPVDSYGVFREDNHVFLGAVSEKYIPIQNVEAFTFVDRIIATGQVKYESAGALGLGERIWVLAKVDKEIRPAGLNDPSECYLLFTTSHDGKGAAKCMLTAVRVVCQNTLQQALAGAKSWINIPHVGDTQMRIEEAQEILGFAVRGFDELEGRFTELARRRVTREVFADVMQVLFPFGRGEGNATRLVRQAEKVAELFELNDNNAVPEIHGSALNLLNAYTEYVDHFRNARRTESAEDPNWRDEDLNVCRRRSAMFGVGNDLKAKAFGTVWTATKDCPRMGQGEPVSVAVDGFAQTEEEIADEARIVEARNAAMQRVCQRAGFN